MAKDADSEIYQGECEMEYRHSGSTLISVFPVWHVFLTRSIYDSSQSRTQKKENVQLSHSHYFHFTCFPGIKMDNTEEKWYRGYLGHHHLIFPVGHTELKIQLQFPQTRPLLWYFPPRFCSKTITVLILTHCSF